MMQDTTYCYSAWMEYEEANGGSLREDAEKIVHLFDGFCVAPTGFHRGVMFSVMSRKADSIEQIEECLKNEIGYKVLRSIGDLGMIMDPVTMKAVHGGYVIRYAVIPLITLHLSKPHGNV